MREKLRKKHKLWRPGTISLGIVLVYIAIAVIPYAFVQNQPQDAYESLPICQSSDYQANRASLLTTGDEALSARLRLIHNARQDIVLANYIFIMDTSGIQVASSLYQAAERGVKVSILLDGIIGLFNLLLDPTIQALAAYPNIEVRVYLPLNLFDPVSLNVRFHEKYMLVDGEWAIAGGRNVSNEFLMERDDVTNSIDLEVMLWKAQQGIRDAVALLYEHFQNAWTSSNPWPSLGITTNATRIAEQQQLLRFTQKSIAKTADLSPINAMDDMVLVDHIYLLTNTMEPRPKEPVLWNQLVSMMALATERVWVISPYLILNQKMMSDLDNVASSTGNLHVLINSVITGNNIPTSADYVLQKNCICSAGFSTYELFHENSLHTKAILIDDHLSAIGSFNFDIRSAYIDPEIMIVVDSCELNAMLEEYMKDLWKNAQLVSGTQGSMETMQGEPPYQNIPKTILIHFLAPIIHLIRYIL